LSTRMFRTREAAFKEKSQQSEIIHSFSPKGWAPDRSKRNSQTHFVQMYIHQPGFRDGLLIQYWRHFLSRWNPTRKTALNLETSTGTFRWQVPVRQCVHNSDALQCITFNS
jgi:hypothetical protein